MMNYNQRIYTLSVVLVCCFHLGFNQNSSPRQDYYDSELQPKTFDQSTWEKLQADLEYENLGREATKASPTENEKAEAEGYRTAILKVVIIAGAIIAITLLLRQLTGLGHFTNKRETSPVSAAGKMELQHQEEQALAHGDLPNLIGEAIRQNDFRLATRLYYLVILQQLRSRSLISWEKRKTNRDYAEEIKNTGFFKDFQSATGNFERIWYGKEPISKDMFSIIEEQFKNLGKKIRG